MQNRGIEAVNYVVAAFGGHDVPLAACHLFGSDALAEAVVAAMAGRHACLMANHGAFAVGETRQRALWRLQELENLARSNLLSRTGGTPVILSRAEFSASVQGFASNAPGRGQDTPASFPARGTGA